jgi:hypothetical protein
MLRVSKDSPIRITLLQAVHLRVFIRFMTAILFLSVGLTVALPAGGESQPCQRNQIYRLDNACGRNRTTRQVQALLEGL